MNRTLRWWVAGLVAALAFGVATYLSGAFLLPLVMKSAADRWVVAAGVGVAVAALAALWGQSWAMRDSLADPGAGAGSRSVSAGGDIGGIASTGDNATNSQQK